MNWDNYGKGKAFLFDFAFSSLGETDVTYDWVIVDWLIMACWLPFLFLTSIAHCLFSSICVSLFFIFFLCRLLTSILLCDILFEPIIVSPFYKPSLVIGPSLRSESSTFYHCTNLVLYFLPLYFSLDVWSYHVMKVQVRKCWVPLRHRFLCRNMHCKIWNALVWDCFLALFFVNRRRFSFSTFLYVMLFCCCCYFSSFSACVVVSSSALSLFLFGSACIVNRFSYLIYFIYAPLFVFVRLCGCLCVLLCCVLCDG